MQVYCNKLILSQSLLHKTLRFAKTKSMDINCRKLNCVHNKKCVCCAKKLDISQKSCCQTYQKDESKKVEDLSKKMFSQTPEYENFRHIKKANIVCKINCMFNENGKCLANGIVILDDNETPICGTFIESCDLKSKSIKKNQG